MESWAGPGNGTILSAPADLVANLFSISASSYSRSECAWLYGESVGSALVRVGLKVVVFLILIACIGGKLAVVIQAP